MKQLNVLMIMAVMMSAGACAAKKPVADQAGGFEAGNWTALFDGTQESLDKHWDYNPDAWQVADGELRTPGKGKDIFSKQKFKNFTLELDFQTTPGTNSGVFIRMKDRKDWLHSSIEIQVLDSFGKAEVGKHDCGAMYDLLAPAHNAVRKPGQWNTYRITAYNNRIWIALNNVQIINADLDDWTAARKNPDGSKNKFRDPIKQITHAGFFALQTHGKPVAYRNIRVRTYGDGEPMAACPVCGDKAPEGWYCAKCKAVATHTGSFRCKGCEKTVKAGTYCAKHNVFRFPADAPKCPGCGKNTGQWCGKCQAYFRIDGVTYDEKTKKPVVKTSGQKAS